MRIARRELLAGALATAVSHRLSAEESGPKLHTVDGELSPAGLGTTLVHEHVMVDFIGADKVSRERYEADEVFAVALPHLKRARELGCRTLLECTPAYLGRDPALLRRLARASGLQILTNTGYYGAAQDKFVPAHARTESVEQLAARWTAEWRDGIEGTGIRPGFIKIGVDPGPLSEIDAKLVRAAALTHRQTGLTIAAHTGDGRAALAEVDTLTASGVHPSAFIWVHAQIEKDAEVHARAATRGAWVEFDGVSESAIDAHVALVSEMRRRGLLDHVLVSHDAGWYNVGEAGGGQYRGYDTLFTRFVPALKRAGLSEQEVRLLLEENPRRALTPVKRLA
jgi:phosphotriesterase-related protein